MLFAIAQSGLLGVQLRQSSLAKFVAVNKELYNVNLDSPFCGWYFWREFIAFLTQKGVPRLYDRAYLLTLLQLLHRTHVKKGAYIVETVRFLNGILERMDAHRSKRRTMMRRLSISEID